VPPNIGGTDATSDSAVSVIDATDVKDEQRTRKELMPTTFPVTTRNVLSPTLVTIDVDVESLYHIGNARHSAPLKPSN
jgi:hypothetical protein